MKITIRIIAVLLLLSVWTQIARASNIYTNAVLADSPLVYYPLDETSGTTATDASGNGRDGTYVSVTLGSASLTNGLGTAAGFDGSSSAVAVPAMGGSYAQASYEVWVKPAAYGGLPAIYDEDGWTGGTSQLMLGDGGVFQYSLNGGGDLFGPPFTLNQWVYLVVTYDSTLTSGHLKFYTNGVLAKTVSADANNAPANLAAAHLGAFNNGGLSRFFTGSMDDFALYGTVLPAGRIRAHYLAALGIPIDITQQPASTAALPGQTATFTVGATASAGTLTYQWQTNGTAILGATNASYTTPPVTLADSGKLFRCVVSSGTNSLTSSSATLTVTQNAYTSAVLVDSPLVFYPLDETSGTTAIDATGNGRNGTYVSVTLGSASPANGLGTAAGFDGSSSTVAVPAMGGSHAQASYEVWLKPTANPGGLPAIYDEDGWVGGTSQLMLNGDTGVFQYSLNGGGDLAGPVFTLNQWVHLVVTYDSTLASGHLKYYTNGVLAKTVSADANNAPANLAAAHLGAFNNGGLSRFFTGSMDDFALYGTVLPASRIAQHYLAGSGIPLVITQQPASIAATAGQDATFTVGATASSGTLTYQWQTNGAAILGATNASYTTAPVTLADSGKIFRCVVSAGTNSLTSSGATLTVSAYVQSAYTSAVLADNPLVFYPLDETSGTTAIDNSGNGRNGTYVNVTLGSASLTNGLGTAVSFNGSSSTVAVPAMGGSHAQASYEVWVKPAANPGSLPAIYDEDGWVTGTSQLMLGGAGVFQYSLNGGGDMFGPAFTLNEWVHLVVTYDSTLAAGHLKFYTNGVLAQTVSASANNVAANLAAAHLGAFANGGLSRFFTGSMDDFALYGTVLPAGRIWAHYVIGAGIPVFTLTQQPASLTRYAGKTASFTVDAVSTIGAVTYQWQTNGNPVLNATNASYTTPPLALTDSGKIFSCVVSAGTNSLTSSNATLTVLPVTSQYATTVLANNPMNYWRFSDGGGTEAFDYCGDVTCYDPSGSPLQAGPQPPAFPGFESTNTAPFMDGYYQGYASGTSLFNNRSNFTLMGWFKIDPSQYPFSGIQFPDGRASLFGQEWAAELGFYQGTNLYFYSSGISATIFANLSTPPTNGWYFVAAVSDTTANTTTLYLNGAVVGSASACPGTVQPYLFSIGKNVAYFPSGGYDNAMFPGSIDEVAAFDHPLSASTVQAIYNMGIGVGSVNQSPTNITVTVSSGQMTLAWPPDHTGWVLEAQTNALNAGLGTNWVRIPGSATTNQVTVPVNAANPTVFYRIVYP